MSLISEVNSYIDYLRSTIPVSGIGRVPFDIVNALPLSVYLSLKLAARAAGLEGNKSRDIIRGATSVLGHSLFSDANLLGPGTGAHSGDGVPGGERIWKASGAVDIFLASERNVSDAIRNTLTLLSGRYLDKNLFLVSPFFAQQSRQELSYVLSCIDPDVKIGLVDSGAYYPYYLVITKLSSHALLKIISDYSGMILQARKNLGKAQNRIFMIGFVPEYTRGWMVQIPEVASSESSYLIAIKGELVGRELPFSHSYDLESWYLPDTDTHVIRCQIEEDDLRNALGAVVEAWHAKKAALMPLEIFTVMRIVSSNQDVIPLIEMLAFDTAYRRRASRIGFMASLASYYTDINPLEVLNYPEARALDKKSLSVLVYGTESDSSMDVFWKTISGTWQKIESSIDGSIAWEVNLGTHRQGNYAAFID